MNPHPAESLGDFRSAVLASLREKIPGVSIETHGGTFDEKEIQVFATKAPAIRIAIVGIGQLGQFGDGEVRVPIHFTAVCVARDGIKDEKPVARDEQALYLANAMQLAVYGNRFGRDGVFRPEDVQARNLYSGTAYGYGLALFEVTWTSPVLLGKSVEHALHALTQMIVNGVVFADPAPVPGAAPLAGEDPIGAPSLTRGQL
jgi:hypothetical protein